MSKKGMYQLLVPFAAALTVVLGFYLILLALIIIELLLMHVLGVSYRSDLIGILDNICDFFNLFGFNCLPEQWVVAVIVWLILTIIIEIWVTDEFDE